MQLENNHGECKPPPTLNGVKLDEENSWCIITRICRWHGLRQHTETYSRLFHALVNISRKFIDK